MQLKVQVFVWIFMGWLMTACRFTSSEPVPLSTQSSQAIASETATLILVPSETAHPTHTRTPAPTRTPSPTVTPSITPTPTVTATYSPIDALNAGSLQLDYSQPDWFIRGKIQSVAWTADDQYVVLRTDKGLHLLDPTTLAEAAVFQGFTPKATNAADLIIAAKGETLGWIDMTTLAFHEINFPGPDFGWTWTPVAINPAGSILAIGDPGQADSLSLFSFPDATLISHIQLKHEKGIRYINKIFFSPDGTQLYVEIGRTDERHSLMRIDLDNPGGGQDLAMELRGFNDLCISPDGERLAYFNDVLPMVRIASNGSLWSSLGMRFPTLIDNVEVNFEGREMSFRDGNSLGIAYSNWGSSSRTMVLVWDINSGKILKTYDHTPGEVIAFEFSNNKDLFILASRDGIIRTYNPDGEEIAASAPYDIPGDVDISPDGRLAAVPSVQGVQIYDLEIGEIVQSVGHYPGSVRINTQFLDHNTLVVSVYPSGMDSYTELWQLDPLERIRKFDISSCRFNANGDVLACESKYIQVLGAELGNITGSFGTADQTYDYQLSPDGGYLAICSANYGGNGDDTVYAEAIGLWALSTATRIRNLLMDGPACGKMAFSPQGDFLVSAAGGIWEVPTGDLVGSFEGRPSGSVVMGPGNDLFLFDQTLLAFPSGDILGEIKYPGRPLVIRFSSDGVHLMVLSEGLLNFWRVMD